MMATAGDEPAVLFPLSRFYLYVADGTLSFFGHIFTVDWRPLIRSTQRV
ncbi:hypothetical protein RF240_16785 [Dickeya dadantii]